MADIAIRVEGLGKCYRVGHQADRDPHYTALRDVLTRQAKALVRTTRDLLRGEAIVPGDAVEAFWALRDVAFEIRQGERVGIIGRNGAGKSTLLKILSRITEPTAGRVEIAGRVASLLEVGTGFHPELTGRENIYLNGAILGMRRREIQRKFDEIVAFAEVERFLDTPVKHFSSGMYMRLAFAVAAHLESEILIVDEVLAVGDAAFQRKCLGKMEEVGRDGRTVLFVSHNVDAVTQLCSRALRLDGGRVRHDASPAEVIAGYLGAAGAPAHYEVTGEGQEEAFVESVTLLVDDQPSALLDNRGAPALRIRVRARSAAAFCVELVLRDANGGPILFWPSGFLGHPLWRLGPGEAREAVIELSLPEMAKGRYLMDVMLAEPGKRFLQYLDGCIGFEVVGSSIPVGAWEFTQSRQQGALLMEARYRER